MNNFTAEFLGTMLLILLGNGVVANVLLKDTKGNNAGWLVIAWAWGLAVFVGVVVAGPVSGAHLNPAVTLALATAGKFAWGEVGTFIFAQLLGAMAGAGLVWLSYRDHFLATDDVEAKLAVFCTGPAIRNYASNFISEAIATFVLVVVILFLSDPNFSAAGLPNAKLGLGSLGALPVALLVVVIGLSLGGTTGYAINPARDFAPRLMHTILPLGKKRDSDWAYAWVPIVAPIVGAVVAAGLYGILNQ
jgi:glycerol uptake facilitator protein